MDIDVAVRQKRPFLNKIILRSSTLKNISASKNKKIPIARLGRGDPWCHLDLFAVLTANLKNAVTGVPGRPHRPQLGSGFLTIDSFALTIRKLSRQSNYHTCLRHR